MAKSAHQKRLERALKAADASGDDRAARLIAKELRKFQPDPEGSVARRFAAGTSRGTAQFLGAPVDITNAMLSVAGLGSEEPLGGSRNIMRGFEKLGVGVSPEAELGRAGTVGEVVGVSVPGAAGVVGAGVKSVASALTQPTRVPSVTTAIIQDVSKTATTNPITFAGSELAAATSAGLARFEALERFPNSPGAQAFAEILGGFTPAGAVVGARGAGRAVGFAADRLPLTGAVIRHIRESIGFRGGAKGRAETRVQKATSDKLEAAAKLGRTDIIDESGLTPAQRIGDPELLALERSVMNQNELLTAERAQQLAFVNQRIRESLLDAPADDVPAHVVREYFEGLLDMRIRQAAAAVDEQLTRLGTNATRADVNALARRELEAAKSAARAQERELYEAIPVDALVPTTATANELGELLIITPKAQRGDIPGVAVRLLKPKIGGKANPNYLGDTTDIAEMRGLQTKLREEARVARDAGQANKARIADNLAETIKDDIAMSIGGPEVKEAVDTAVSFSAMFNDRFTRGAVGRLLKTSGGKQALDPTLTLEASVGKRGPRAASETDALLNAVNLSGDVPAMRGHIQGFLIDDFRRAAVTEGRIDSTAGRNWMAQNKDTLDRFPELRRDMNDAIQAGGTLVDAERLADPLVSRAAVFIRAVPGREISRILQTSKPRDAMNELLRMARTDPTGRAEQGLKTAFFDHLLRKSQVDVLDVNDVRFISGQRMSDELSDEAVLEAMRGIFSSAEFKRIEQIRKTSVLLDAARKSPESTQKVIKEETPLLLRLITRVGAAAFGRRLAEATGGGNIQTPGLMVAETKRLVEAGITVPAKRLISDAIQDESLFRALLTGQATPAARKATRARLNAWVLDVLAQQNQVEKDDE